MFPVTTDVRGPDLMYLQGAASCTNDGTIWLAGNGMYDGIAFNYSKDNGQTWSVVYSPDLNPTDSERYYEGRPALFIDEDDYAHWLHSFRGTTLSGTTTYDSIKEIAYRRGIPNADRTDWTWSSEYVIKVIDLPNGYLLNKLQIVAVRYSTAWRAAVVWSEVRDDGTALSTGVGAYGYYRLLTITGTTSSTVTLGAVTTLFSYAGSDPAYAGQISLDLQHNGNGKTSKNTTPKLYCAFNATFAYGTTTVRGIKYKQATFASGSWTWGTERAIDATRWVYKDEGLLCRYNNTEAVIIATTYDNLDMAFMVYTRNEADTATTTDIASSDWNAVSNRWDSNAAFCDVNRKIHLFLPSTDYYPQLERQTWDIAAKTLSVTEAIDGTTVRWLGMAKYHQNGKMILFYGSYRPTSKLYIHAWNSLTAPGVVPDAPVITSPVMNAQIASSHTISVSVGTQSDSQSVYGVLEYSSDDGFSWWRIGITPLTASGGVAQYTWDTTNAFEGRTQIRCRLIDTDGNFSLPSGLITVQVGDTKTVSINRTDTNTTSQTALAFLGKHNKRMVAAADGTLVSLFSASSTSSWRWLYSKDGGVTWNVMTLAVDAATGSEGNATGIPVSIYMDKEDYLHIAYINSGLRYKRATPNADRTGWTTTSAALIHSNTGLNYPDLIAHKNVNGVGWTVHIITSYVSGSTNFAYYYQVPISDTGVVTIPSPLPTATLGGSYASSSPTWPSIDFYHTGDGKTVKDATPHLFALWSSGASTAGKGMRFKKGAFSGGVWTWGAEVELAGRNLSSNTNFGGWGSVGFDGTDVLIVGGFHTTSSSNLTLEVYKRDVADTTTTLLTQFYASSSSYNANILSFGTWGIDSSGTIWLIGSESRGSNEIYDRRYMYYTYNKNTAVSSGPTIITAVPPYIQNITCASIKYVGRSVPVLLTESWAYSQNSSSTRFGIKSWVQTLSSPPNIPAHNNISNAGYTLNKRPKVFISVSTPDNLAIKNAQVQMSTDQAFATTLFDVQYGSDSGYGTNASGWAGLPTVNGSATAITWTPTGDLPISTTTAVYLRARAKSDGGWSDWTPVQAFYVYPEPWNDTLTPNLYGMKAVWMNDLANVINSARQFRSLGAIVFTDGTITAQTTDVKSTHVTERRTRLQEVLAIVGITPTWTDATPTDRNTQHIIELRNYSKQT